MAAQDTGRGIGSAAGGIAGSFIPGVGTALGALGGGALGGLLGGMFGRKKLTKTQKQQQQLIDQLMASLNGQGPYSDLFNANEEQFQKYFGDPARAQFKNQTTPMIQQSFIEGGQQRNTGLNDTLTRAGVDMDQLINQHYMQYAQGKEQNKLGAIDRLLGVQGNEQQSYGSAAMQGLGGYLSGDRFGKDTGNFFDSIFKQKSTTKPDQPEQKGYEG